ncbi:MAG: c-type cytochrome [Chloroflexi bacterium]|nr:c-type cytochrome [Chloroflexota bacterium]
MQQKIIIGFVLTLIIVVFIPVYWAMEPARQEAALNRQRDEAVARGAELFSANCAVCHGAQGEGNIGPALKGTRLSENTLKKTIARGVPGTAMAALSKEDAGPFHPQNLSDLVTFIKNWDGATPSSAPPAEPPATPAAVSADKLFANTCAACHGVNREGISGLGPALTPGSLAGLSDDEIRNTILNGRSATVMPAFKNRLSPEEIDALLRLIKYTAP